MKRKIILLTILCILLFSFHFWIGFPGQIVQDTKASLFLSKENWHPVIISYVLQFLFFCFGKHVYLFFLMQLVPLYLGVFLITLSLLKKYHSLWTLFALFPIFIDNIFFSSIVLRSSFLSPLWIFLLYSLTFYQLMFPPDKKWQKYLLYCGIDITFCLALLSRHNAILQVYPIFFVWIFQLKKQKNLNMKQVFILLTFSIIFSLSFAVYIPKLISKQNHDPAYHIYLDQIVGTCVFAQDSNCIPADWYAPNKNWETAVKTYHVSEIADWTYIPYLKDKVVFKGTIPISTLKKYWIRTLFNYPKHFFEYTYRKYAKKMLFSQFNLVSKETIYNRQNLGIAIFDIETNTSSYRNYSPVKMKAYKILKLYLPSISTIYFVSFCLIIFLISGILILKKKYTDILIFTFATAFSGVIATIFFILFTPGGFYRYMHPILISAILSFYGLSAYILNAIMIKKR